MKVKINDKKDGPSSIRLEMFDSIRVNFFRILATREYTSTQTGNTERETVELTIANQICIKRNRHFVEKQS